MKNIIFIAPPAAGKGTISERLVKDFNYESNVGYAIHVKWEATGIYFGNTIHIAINDAERRGLGRRPASHGCPTISPTFRDKLKRTYGNKLINSKVIYF